MPAGSPTASRRDCSEASASSCSPPGWRRWLLPEAPTTFDIVWRLTLSGIGFGLFQSPNNKVIITSAPRERSGGASGMQASARLVGQSLGAALVAVLFGLVPGGPAGAFAVTLWCAVALALAGALASGLRRTGP